VENGKFSAMRARCIGIWRLLIAIGVAVIATIAHVSTASAGQGLDRSVVVVNSRGVLSGSVETFAAGSNKNRTPQFNDILRGGKSNGGFPILMMGSGVAVSPATGLNFVASGGTNAVLGFLPTLNGINLPPDQMISSFDPLCNNFGIDLCTPDGVAFNSMANPSFDTPEQLYVANLGPPLVDTAGNACGAGSIAVSDSSANGVISPNLLIYGCNDPPIYGLSLADPVGLFVDEATVDLCLGSADNAMDLCDPSSGNQIMPVPTRRIWELSRKMLSADWQRLNFAETPTFFGGNVSVYTPELADVIDALGLAPSVTGRASFCDSNNFCNEPAFGGLFFTTTDGLPPDELPPPQCPSSDGSSCDLTNPDYLAVNTAETAAYVTDIDGGFRNRGRVKSFALSDGGPICWGFDAVGDCTLAVKESVNGVYTGAIEGQHTTLNLPMGIGVATVAGGDELFVTNVNADSLVEFGPGASGDAAPIASVRGRQTGMIQPAGIALTPPPLIP
jgi:hypothetical protein